ncbi:MAG: hypothetical protein AB4372_16795 [Xenococcus sp. (in: cyanobacteria)]
MASPAGTQWEQAVLIKLTSNGERIALVERDISEIKDRLKGIENRMTGLEKSMEKIESLLSSFRWIGGGIVAIALSLIANFVYSLIA